MHIGIDGNLIGNKPTGMGIVAYSLIKELVNKEIEITIFFSKKIDKEMFNYFKTKNINIICKECNNFFIWEQLILPKLARKNPIDILWCPYNTAPLFYNKNLVITVHDLIFMDSDFWKTKTIHKKLGVIYRKFVVPKVLEKASRIITVSNFSKEEIIKKYSMLRNKIDVIPNGVNKKTICLTNSEKKTFFSENHITKKYILGFGSLEPRKNSLNLIKAYTLLPKDIQNEFDLVLFGFRNYNLSEDYKFIKQNKLRNIKILGYISEREKDTLYNDCEVFVFPSFSEGFGIPILEAYRSLKPVITSNTTSLPEIGGNAAFYVDPNNIHTIASTIEKVLRKKFNYNRLIKDEKNQLDLFDWKESANKLFRIFSEVEKSNY